MGAYGAYPASDDEAPPAFKHRNRRVVEHWIMTAGAAPAELKPVPAGTDAMTNEVIAHISNTWGPYEMPRFGLTERVRHLVTGEICTVMGYYGWKPPILLYALTDAQGVQLPALTSVSEIAHLEPGK